MRTSLNMTDTQRRQLYEHLFPGDGLEALALVLCGRRAGEHHHRLLVREIYRVEYGDCDSPPGGRNAGMPPVPSEAA